MYKKIFKFRLVLLVLVCIIIGGILIGCQADSTGPADQTEDAIVEDEEFPARPIRVIVHTPAGGGADTNMRYLQPYLEKELGVPIMIDNRPGAASMMGPKLVSESDGDGYTIGMGGSPHNEVGLLTMEGMFEPDDICMLAGLTRDAAVIQVRDDAPWDTLEEFIEDAKNRPGEITASVGTATGDNYLGFRLIEEAAGIDLNIVSFGGGSPARLALAGGHVDVNHASLFSSQHIADSRKVLAVHWEENNWKEIIGDVPTVAEVLPGIGKENCGTIDFILAPAELKEKYPARYQFLAEAFERAINNPEFQNELGELGRDKHWNYMNHEEMTNYFYDNIESYRGFLHYFQEEVEEREN